MADFTSWARRIVQRVKGRRVTAYRPRQLVAPNRSIDVPSAWKGHELVLADVIARFGLGTDRCLEFGVEFGYSTVALSAFFREVVGVDLFTGDLHTDHHGDHFERTSQSLARYPNIRLVRSDYRDWIAVDDSTYDLIHIDIVHTYEDTYRCGLWAAAHARCVLFHDTESFPAVKRAVKDIARRRRKTFYNYTPHYGLGILA